MRKILNISLCILTSIIYTSCNLEDDIDEIFIGRTWYMVGGKLNGKELNTEVKNFYSSAGTNAYHIDFQPGTFTGVLELGVNFSGTWQVNAKTRDMSFHYKNEPSPNSPFDHNVYSVIKNIQYYKGDSRTLILYVDKNNFIRLNHER